MEQAIAGTLDWILRFVMRPDDRLGRKGAVCPFMEQAMQRGRVALHPVRVERPADTARLCAIARDRLRRITSASSGSDDYDAALFVPVGASPDVLRAAVTDAQAALRAEALRHGCMIGEFYPGHAGPSVRNPEFKPLQSPHPILGIRTMVDSDILFFRATDASAPEYRLSLDMWHRFFGDRAPESLRETHACAMRALGPRPGG